MKTATKQCAQGDVLFRRVKAVPDDARRSARSGQIVVAHSETGHHHAIADDGIVLFESPNPLVGFLVMESVEYADVVHQRPWDTHETVRLGGGIGAVWEVRRQREWSPEGWRRVQD